MFVTSPQPFVASNGWLRRFKIRHSLPVHRKKSLLMEGGYSPSQVDAAADSDLDSEIDAILDDVSVVSAVDFAGFGEDGGEEPSTSSPTSQE